MEKTGATPEDFAQVAVKSRRAAALNPLAQFREPTSVEAVLASRMISAPLTLMMCSAIGDGAAAVVVCSVPVAARLGVRPIRIRASRIVSANRDGAAPLAAERAARLAYEQAGVGPRDIDVAGVHDASAPAELMVYETIGLCGPGEAPAFLRSGATGLGGRLSVNPSGGLLGRGHPVGATGCAQIVRIRHQLPRILAGPCQAEAARKGCAGGERRSHSAAMQRSRPSRSCRSRRAAARPPSDTTPPVED